MKTPSEDLQVFEIISKNAQHWNLTFTRTHQRDLYAENSNKIYSLKNMFGKIMEMMQQQMVYTKNSIQDM